MSPARVLVLVSAGIALASPARGTIWLCYNDSNKCRQWLLVPVPDFHCEDLTMGPGEECFNFQLAGPPPTGEVFLHGFPQSLDPSVILGWTETLIFVGRGDGQNFALRSYAPDPYLIEAAPLPDAPDLLPLGPVFVGMEFRGEPISLPSFAADFKAGDVTSGDFAVFFMLCNPATFAVEEFRVEAVNYADLQFQVVGRVCVGDITQDSRCDLADLATLLSNFGSNGAGYADGDLDGTGVVDLSDLTALLQAFGSTCTRFGEEQCY